MTPLDPERAVVVTGGTVRLGLAVAERLASRGWTVVATSSRAEAGADIVADLSAPRGAEELFSAVEKLLGGRPPFAIVNNAGLFAGPEDVLTAVNLTAPVRLAELMSRRKSPGAVVNILDKDCLAPCRGDGAEESVYMKTKRLLAQSTLDDAVRYAGVLRVNAVAPGSVLPPPCGGVKAGPMPFGRPAPMQVADAVAFLLDASATTGAVIPVG